MKQIRLHIDDRSRVCLSAFLPKGGHISSLKAYEKDGKIILEPMVEIPARELWLHNNKEALSSLRKGIEDAKAGRVRYIGSFAEFADDDLEE